jgi:hypothetical protein
MATDVSRAVQKLIAASLSGGCSSTMTMVVHFAALILALVEMPGMAKVIVVRTLSLRTGVAANPAIKI